MLIHDAEVDGRPIDVRITGGVIAEVGTGLDDHESIDGRGGALLPGLHDHHIHLRALAAARASVVLHVGDDVGARLRDAPAGWVRAVGYHESMAGPLDRWSLDRLTGDRPVRVQHRTGELWILNSAAARVAGLADDHDGLVWRADDWLRERVPPAQLDLEGVGRDAAAAGVTGFTDATPGQAVTGVRELSGALPQRLHLMMPPAAEVPDDPLMTRGPVKFLLDDTTLPPVDELAARFAEARRGGRRVAVHCVTRVQLVATMAAGLEPGDRIEHGAIIPPELIGELARLGVVVVTQPNFVTERAEQYRSEIEPDEVVSLYRCRSLLDAGVCVAIGTDAPFGGADPWAAMRSAVSRELGPDERIDPGTALRLFTGFAATPGLPRAVAVGLPADLCLLHVPLEVALRDLDASNVRATFVAGRLVAGR